jgi:hypothetical protein
MDEHYRSCEKADAVYRFFGYVLLFIIACLIAALVIGLVAGIVMS